MTTIPLSKPKPIATFAARLVAAALIAASIYIAYQSGGSLSFVIAMIGASTSLLVALFVRSALQRALSPERLDFDQEKLTIRAPSQETSFSLSKPYQLHILKTEGDHKERGGSILLSLTQDQKHTLLLGALGRGELPPECESLFAAAKEVSYEELQRDAQHALWLPKDGDMARLLPLFGKAGNGEQVERGNREQGTGNGAESDSNQ